MQGYPFAQPLLLDDAQAFVQGVNQRAGGGVMVRVFRAPVFHQPLDVQVPGGDGFRSRCHPFNRPGPKGDRAESRRRPQAFLGTGIADIDLVLIHLDRHSPQGSDRIHDEHATLFVDDLGDLLDRL